MKLQHLLDYNEDDEPRERIGFEIEVHVSDDADTEFVALDTMYDGDDEAIKKKMQDRVLKAKTSNPHWLGEDDEEAVKRGLDSVEGLSVDYSDTEEQEGADWPNLAFYVYAVDSDTVLPQKPRDVSLGRWAQGNKTSRWRLAIEAEIIDILRNRGKNVGNFDVRFNNLP